MTATLDRIKIYLQDELHRQQLAEVSAVEAAQWLDAEGILKDSPSRPGLPLRNYLRSGQVLGGTQRPAEKHGRWFIVGPKERARTLLEQQDLMVLATADTKLTPWISPVFYAIDEDYNLFWVSARAARHSELVREHGHVAIVVFATAPADGVYLSATATELHDRNDVDVGIDVMDSKPQPGKWVISDPTDVTGGGPWRIYKAVPDAIEVRRETEINGKAVVERIDADFRERAS
ncbi:MAG: hypothetical protein QOH76_3512 [Thermoleophilaceae bacterium]|jgi:hypothetical protein|nr:hypothetical protein [Thermoleophilaceae bacterium]